MTKLSFLPKALWLICIAIVVAFVIPPTRAIAQLTSQQKLAEQSTSHNVHSGLAVSDTSSAKLYAASLSGTMYRPMVGGDRRFENA